MTTTTGGANPANLSEILPWLVAMGADEVLLDAPVDRFAASARATPAASTNVAVAPRAMSLPTPPPPAANMADWKAVAAGAEGVAAAETLAANVETIEAYISAFAAFEAHPLHKTANRPCLLAAAPQARVLVLCDRPRNDEDRSGEVLAANHAILASRMLASIGLGFEPGAAGEAVSLANFLPWRPPGNRTPTELECKMCVPMLRKLLQLLRPKLILAFGALPGQWLAQGEETIFKARGQWLDCEGIPMLTTFHPEILLKSPPSKRLAWHDLQKFQARLSEIS